MLHPVLMFLLVISLGAVSVADGPGRGDARKAVIGLTTVYHYNSHADMFYTRLLRTETLDDRGRVPSLRLRSLYVDQIAEKDLSQSLCERYRVARSLKLDAFVQEAGQGPVEGVLLVAEHGKYPSSPTGQVVYPKRRLFEAVLRVFEKTGKPAPVFIDKHLSDNWTDAKWIYDTARARHIPLMAGSSLPLTWRYPPVDVKRGARLKQIVAVSYHTLDGYGFHALETVQALAERRAGGETGIQQVRCLVGPAVWEAGRVGVYDRHLLDQALARLKERPIPNGQRIEDLVKEPVLFVMDYVDGLRASVVTLNYAVGEWAAAWEYADGGREATLFWTQEVRPLGHFTPLLLGIERMMQTGRPSWPVERTLLTSGTLDALLISKQGKGSPIKTPYLHIPYRSAWDWEQPPPPVQTSGSVGGS